MPRYPYLAVDIPLLVFFLVHSAASVDEVGALVTRACVDTFDEGGRAAAVLIEQRVIGVKLFMGDSGKSEGER